ncbi:MAG: hypothetical protein KatS3mg102_0842 [Planctomycetota bacterium]|nr:MAG: hypothetical protein KatS3mg102_0842 [Planctomycetota bacterium]
MDPVSRELLIAVAALALGACCGSFLNVVIHRLPRAEEGLGLGRPRRSFCPRCRASIAWYDNLPLLSYLVLGGRCRSCRGTIPLRYFLVEAASAGLFVLVAYRTLILPPSPQWELALAQAALLAAMVAVAGIDLEHLIIPDRIDKPGMVLAPLVSCAVPALHAGHGDLQTLAAGLAALGLGDGSAALEGSRLGAALASLLGIAFGAGLVGLIRWLGTLAFRKEAMGLGDVKYMGMLGGYLGWKGVLLALGVAVLSGALVGIAMKLLTREPYVPFGPFLSLGGAAALLFHHELVWALFVGYPSLLYGAAVLAPAPAGRRPPPGGPPRRAGAARPSCRAAPALARSPAT